ncbi:MAG: dihydrofolate reductase family protein [Ilumatobacteraceae bacterium]
MQRIFDEGSDHPSEQVTVRSAYDVVRPRPTDRPWIALCMVASIDGTTVIDHRSGALSSDIDKEVLSTLRSLADLIIVGAGTVRAERYGPPAKSGQRIGVVSHSGNIDTSIPLFTSGAGFLIVPEDAPSQSIDTVRAGVGTLDLGAALAQLDADFIQAEGGPGLNGSLLDADLVDELNLTISPQLVGGDGQRVTNGATAVSRGMRLAHVLEDDGFLFTRYVRR